MLGYSSNWTDFERLRAMAYLAGRIAYCKDITLGEAVYLSDMICRLACSSREFIEANRAEIMKELCV